MNKKYTVMFTITHTDSGKQERHMFHGLTESDVKEQLTLIKDAIIHMLSDSNSEFKVWVYLDDEEE